LGHRKALRAAGKKGRRGREVPLTGKGVGEKVPIIPIEKKQARRTKPQKKKGGGKGALAQSRSLTGESMHKRKGDGGKGWG